MNAKISLNVNRFIDMVTDLQETGCKQTVLCLGSDTRPRSYRTCPHCWALWQLKQWAKKANPKQYEKDVDLKLS